MAAGGGGDRDVTFRFLADVGDAVEGIKSVGTETKELAADIKTVPAAATELEAAMTRAAAAVAKLSDPKLSPRALQRAVLDADIATEGLAEAMKKAQATGGPVSADMTAKVKGFESAVVSANVRAGELRDRLGDMRVKGDQAAQGFEKMSQYGGSATSMMQGLADSSTGLVGGFGKAALAAFGVVEAFKLGYSAGEKLREGFKELTGREMPNMSKWLSELVTGANMYSDAEARAGVITRGNLSQMHTKNQHLQTELDILIKLAPEWNKAADAMSHSVAFGKEFEKVLKLEANAHKDVAKFGKEHADSIIENLAPALKAGTISVMGMSAEMRTAVRAALDQVDAEKKISQAIVDTTQKIQEKFAAEELAIARKVVAAEKEIAAANLSIQNATKERDAKIKALKEMELSDEEYNKRKREIVKETADKVEAASEKEEEATDKITEAQDEYNKKAEETRREIAVAVEGIKKQAEAYDTVKMAMEKLGEQFDPLVKRIADGEAEMKKMNEVMQIAGREADALAEKFRKLGEAAATAAGASKPAEGIPM